MIKKRMNILHSRHAAQRLDAVGCDIIKLTKLPLLAIPMRLGIPALTSFGGTRTVNSTPMLRSLVKKPAEAGFWAL